jgi:HK97 family phage major capsid protein
MTEPTPITNRDDALAVIVETRSREVISAAIQASTALRTFRKLNMGTKTHKMPVLASLPEAQWLSTDTSKKPTTKISYDEVDITAEEIAAIAVIPENVLDDATVDIWADVRARVAEAIGLAIDKAIFFGDGAPATFPTDGIYGGAVAANHELDPGDYPDGDLAELINQTMALVEDDGFDADHGYSSRALKPKLRGLRDDNGMPIYQAIREGVTRDSVYGVPYDIVSNGAWDRDLSQLIIGDPNMAIIGVRQDLTVKMLDQATVGDYNLAEQDSLALRVKARFGFVILTPLGLGQTETPYPFATLKPAA